jgi:hypothetical protein
VPWFHIISFHQFTNTIVAEYVHDKWGNKNQWRRNVHRASYITTVTSTITAPLSEPAAPLPHPPQTHANPAPCIGARVEVQWSVGRDKDQKHVFKVGGE